MRPYGTKTAACLSHFMGDTRGVLISQRFFFQEHACLSKTDTYEQKMIAHIDC